MANDNGPIVQIVTGQESVYGTASTTWHQIFADGRPNVQDVRGRKITKVQNGSYSGATIRALNGQRATLQIKTPVLYDQAGYLFTHVFGFPTTTPVGSGAFRHTWLFPMAVSAAAWASESFQIYNNIYWRTMTGARAVTAKLDLSGDDVPMLDISYLGRVSSGADASPAPTFDVPNAYGQLGSRALQVNVNDVDAGFIKGSVTVDNKLVPFYTANRGANMKRQKRNGLSDFKFDFLFDWVDYAGSPRESFDNDLDLGKVDMEWLSVNEVIGTSALHPRLLVTAKNLISENADEQEDQGESAVHLTGQGDYYTGALPNCVTSVVLENNIVGYGANA